jgi:hypothetical protein
MTHMSDDPVSACLVSDATHQNKKNHKPNVTGNF